jgi:hypothetical protein
MQIAANPVLANPDYAGRLPTSMRTLSELATIPAPTLEGYIKNGVINIGTERQDVEALKGSGKRKAKATHGSYLR